jgi:uncharacterized protein with ParB-like and HNH nuclease domain
LGDILNNRFSDFDARKYGAKTLTTLVKTIENLEITQDNTTSFVSIKSKCTFEDISIESKQILEKKADKQISLNKLKQELEKRYGTIEFKTLGFTKFSKMIQSIDGFTVANDMVKMKK